MALIKCPECGHDVSSAAASCPQCGAPILPQESHALSQLGEVKTNYVGGCLAIIFGIAMLLISIPLIAAIIGIFTGIASIFIIAYGFGLTIGRQDCTCPHCGKEGKLLKTETRYKCPSCKQISYVKDGFLFANINDLQ